MSPLVKTAAKPLVKVIAVTSLLLISGGAASRETETVVLEPNTWSRFLDKKALEITVERLADLKYPMTRVEVMAGLGLSDRKFPSLRTTDGSFATEGDLLTPDREAISLTDPDKGSRRYFLLLWYNAAARTMAGESFIKARVVDYAEVWVADDGSADAPKAQYVLQPSRFPYRRLEYSHRAIRTD